MVSKNVNIYHIFQLVAKTPTAENAHFGYTEVSPIVRKGQ